MDNGVTISQPAILESDNLSRKLIIAVRLRYLACASGRERWTTEETDIGHGGLAHIVRKEEKCNSWLLSRFSTADYFQDYIDANIIHCKRYRDLSVEIPGDYLLSLCERLGIPIRIFRGDPIATVETNASENPGSDQ